MPTAIGPPPDPSISGPASEPLPSPTSESVSGHPKAEKLAEQHLGPQKDSKHLIAQIDSSKPRLQSLIGPEAISPSIYRSASQQRTPSPTSGLVTGSSEVKPRTISRKPVSIQAQQEKRHLQSAGKEVLTGYMTPGTPSEPLASPSALPVTDVALGSTHIGPLTIRKRQITPGENLDPNIETAHLETSLEETPNHRLGAIKSDDPMFLRTRELGHLANPSSDGEDEGQISGGPKFHQNIKTMTQRDVADVQGPILKSRDPSNNYIEDYSIWTDSLVNIHIPDWSLDIYSILLQEKRPQLPPTRPTLLEAEQWQASGPNTYQQDAFAEELPEGGRAGHNASAPIEERYTN
jgi:hypothetical protein